MLSLGKAGDFDSQNIFAPSIVKENGRYFLFYSGGPFGPANAADFVKYRIGLALSNDGETWRKTGQPLLPLGVRDDFHATPALLRNPDGTLHKPGGLWHMAFCGNRADDVELATSPDGLRWTKDSRSPIFRRAYSPNLLRVGNEFRMYYIHKPGLGGGDRRPWEIHLAIGPDLFSLRPHSANPVLTISQPWERGALFYPYVIREDNRWVLLYAAYWNRDPAARINYTAIGIASGPDGLRWTKSDANPILTPIPGSAYESAYNSSQSVIRDGGHYKLYYATRIDTDHKYYAICLARKQGKLLDSP
jgi:predicted GH43/DUF377 family glycosyl hydrolase